jgi:8-oxo-dGTP pyrophosphatase MutT (NUDIX family)
MVKFSWNKAKVPDNIVVRQVYGIVFTEKGKIVLRIEDGKYKLTGGKPEKNETYEQTLKREYIEELNIEVDNIFYLGYLLVEDESTQYAQVRMIAKIKNIGKSIPDVDSGKTYGRVFCDYNNIKKYLKYKDLAGNKMLDDAIVMAKEKFKIF